MDPLPAESTPSADTPHIDGPVLHRFHARRARDADGGLEWGLGTRVTLTPEALIIGRFLVFSRRYDRADLTLLDREAGLRDGARRMSFHVRRRPFALMLDVPDASVDRVLDWLDARELRV